LEQFGKPSSILSVRTKADTKRGQVVLYRIYTQDEPVYREAIIRAFQRHGFSDLTLMSAVGYGPGQGGNQENVAVIDIATNYSPGIDRRIQAAASDICRDNRQQSVLVVRVPAYPKLVTTHRADKAITITSHIMRASDSDACNVGADERLLRKRASYRGKILASFGAWEGLLGKGEIVQGKLVRFFA